MDKRSTKRLNLSYKVFIIWVTAFLAATSVFSNDKNPDPFEPVNRVIFSVNDVLDRWILRPTAVVYKAIMPKFAERGVRNFFGNVGEVRNVVHNTLQGKLAGSGVSTSRFLINTTVGVGGFFDVASKIGFDVKREDLGQTLGSWGMQSGPYLVLPLVGPSSMRDILGVAVDPFMSPLNYAYLDLKEQIAIGVINGLQTRADLMSAESLSMGDKYLLYQQAYLSKREFDVNDGQVKKDDFIDDDSSSDSNEDEFVDEEF